MISNYKRLGDYIQLVDERNKDLKVNTLLGLTINKEFIPSVANTVGTNMANYKIIRRNQFACSLMQVRRDKKIPIALLKNLDEAIISQAYPVFEVIDPNILNPDYLMMWFSREEFDRHALFLAVGGVRGSLEWEDFCNMQLPIPSIEKQNEIVKEYNTVVNLIKLNEQLNQKLEETAQAIYKHWFVDFEFPNKDGKPYKSSGGKMVWNEVLEKEIPEGWRYGVLGSVCSKIGSGSTPRGGRENYKSEGISLIRSMNVHDFYFEYKDLAFIDEVQSEKLKNAKVIEDDILLNITGASVARCTKVPKDVLPAHVNQHVAIIRLEDVNVSNFVLCTLCSDYYKQKLIGLSESGSTREAITKEDINNFEILLPHKDLLEKFEIKIKSIFHQRERKNYVITRLDELRNILLSKMSKL